MPRARSERSGGVREEELTGLFERDALVFHAARRQHALDSQYEGLVFGRLDIGPSAEETADAPAELDTKWSSGGALHRPARGP